MEKWALAMEGGSLRCMFSAGAVDVMMERQLWANGVFGVSAGALTGVNYVSRQVGRTAQVNLDFVNDKRYLGLGNLIFKKSIFNFDFLFGEISDSLLPLDREGFARSEMEFTAVTTDCRTGQPAYWEKHRCGDIYGAIRASASMPLLSPTVEVEGIPCVDGGVSVSLPEAAGGGLRESGGHHHPGARLPQAPDAPGPGEPLRQVLQALSPAGAGPAGNAPALRPGAG